jgi:hypothetical protein
MNAAVEPLPPIRDGEKRAFLLCNCGCPGWYDYRPFSLSVPIISLVCGHDHSLAARVSEPEFFASASAYLASAEPVA